MGLFSIFKKKEQALSLKMEDAFPDISHWEKIDFGKFKGKVLITKCSEGTSIIDSTYLQVKEQCQKNDIKFGAYHFFRSNMPPLAQAKYYLENLGKMKDTDFPPILDIETLDGASTIGCKQTMRAWLEYVEANTGKTPIIYSSNSFLESLNLDSSFAKYPLWLARYTNIRPIAPAPWKDWYMWQFSDSYHFDGIGECDGNIFNE